MCCDFSDEIVEKYYKTLIVFVEQSKLNILRPWV